MDAELLNEIFRFQYKLPSASQSEATCDVLVGHFRGFVETIEPVQAGGFAFAAKNGPKVPSYQVEERELDELKRACGVLGGRDEDTALKRGDVWIEKWFPEYGCALQMEMVSVAWLELKLVFLDGWKHGLHCLPGGKYVHTAVPTEYRALNCERLKPSAKNYFMVNFYRELEFIKREPAHNSSRHRNDQVKHHKTPQFIASLMDQKIGESEDSFEVVVSRGGTTDVGLHTEGSYRDACWPLVQGVIAQHLSGASVLFAKRMLLFKIYLLQTNMNALGGWEDGSSNRLKGPRLLADAEGTYVMLQDVGLQAVGLAQLGYNACAIEAICSTLRDDLLKCLATKTERSAALSRLPSIVSLKEVAASMRYPTAEQLVYEDHFKKPSVSVHDDVYIREELGYLEYVDPQTCSPASLISWLMHFETIIKKENVTILALRTVEMFMFAKASQLQEDSSAQNDLLLHGIESHSQCIVLRVLNAHGAVRIQFIRAIDRHGTTTATTLTCQERTVC